MNGTGEAVVYGRFLDQSIHRNCVTEGIRNSLPRSADAASLPLPAPIEGLGAGTVFGIPCPVIDQMRRCLPLSDLLQEPPIPFALLSPILRPGRTQQYQLCDTCQASRPVVGGRRRHRPADAPIPRSSGPTLAVPGRGSGDGLAVVVADDRPASKHRELAMDHVSARSQGLRERRELRRRPIRIGRRRWGAIAVRACLTLPA